MSSDIDKILTMLEKAHGRIEDLESQVLRQQAMINAVLLCLRDLSKADRKKWEAAFKHYTSEVHQDLLEIVEDHDPWAAARLDKRPLL